MSLFEIVRKNSSRVFLGAGIALGVAAYERGDLEAALVFPVIGLCGFAYYRDRENEILDFEEEIENYLREKKFIMPREVIESFINTEIKFYQQGLKTGNYRNVRIKRDGDNLFVHADMDGILDKGYEEFKYFTSRRRGNFSITIIKEVSSKEIIYFFGEYHFPENNLVINVEKDDLGDYKGKLRLRDKDEDFKLSVKQMDRALFFAYTVFALGKSKVYFSDREIVG